ncbi:histidine kinase [Actinoplanes sp. NPDC051411]|uniref:sensor histidine kinase n=1 Tax=Actinoplanes sp. NPDC051411 TaxID=3155522 RepID=UPI00344A38F2
MTLTPGLLVRGLRPRGLYLLDALLAAALTVACGLSAGEPPRSGGWHEPVGVTLLAALLIGAPVAARRLRPVPALALSLTFSAAALASGVIPDYASGSVVAVLAFELYLVGSEVATRSVPTLLVTLVVLTVAVIRSAGGRGSLLGTAFVCLVAAGAWLLGWIRRERRRHAAQVAEQLTQGAVGDERLRIARELHDIVAHSMSLIAVRAGVADHVFEARPQEARAALRDIEATSRSALGQLRQVVEVLREEDRPYAPAPGLADLRTLADRAASGGVTVRLTITDDSMPGGSEAVGPAVRVASEEARQQAPPGVGPETAGRSARVTGAGGEVTARVPEAVGLSAYRIVQEALTNVVKHAAPAACTVTVTVTGAEVRVRVANDGVRLATTRAPGGGHGLIGMRERVAAWGGEFSAGPGDDEGFVVTATLPYRGADS